jgi:plasmid stability protein
MGTTLVFDDIDPAVAEALFAAAARNGRSGSAELEAILRETLCGPPRRSFKELLASMPNVGRDEDFERHAQ